jgi:hypothetical protein
VPSKKQRRRRAKAFRHEYDLVLVDADGNELPVDPEERRSEREAKVEQRTKAKPARGQTSRGGKTLREPPFLFKSAPLGIRLAWGLFYAAAFVPLTYFVDRTAYRTYLRRLERANTPKS